MHTADLRPARTRTQAYFWWLAVLLALGLAAASAPSPLYRIYQAEWNFSPAVLTVIYAVYAFGALVALLVTGRLSDHVGRRPVASLGLALQVMSALAFLIATSVEGLIGARILQGVATGIATAAISAWLIDLQPPTDQRLGGLIAGVSLVAGLGLGALVSGLAIDVIGDPLHSVFWILLAAFTVGLLSMPFVPDVVARRPGWLASLRPRIALASEARAAFLTSAPSMVAIWAIGGLYLALAPSLTLVMLDNPSHIAGGAVIAALLVTSAAAAFVTAGRDPRRVLVAGSWLLAFGVGLTLAAVAARSFIGLVAASIVAGVGFGPAFSAILRWVAPLAAANQRGALLAALYIEVYLSFSLPTIVAGYAVGPLGLVSTTYLYGAVVIVLALLTALLLRRNVAS